MFELDCPNCGHHLRIHEGYAGRRGKCRHCQAPIQVPEAPKAPEPETPKLGAGRFARTPVDHTGLAALEAADEWTPPPVPEEPAEEFKKLGCLYWFVAIFFCPGALIWGIVLPKGHPQRKMAIFVPIVFMVIGLISVLIVGALIVSSVAIAGKKLNEIVPEVTFSTPGAPPPPGQGPLGGPPPPPPPRPDAPIQMGASLKNVPVFPGMDLVEGDVRVPGSGPLATMDPALRTSLTGLAPADYEMVFNYFKEVLEDTGWKLVSSGIMRAPEQSASISAYDDEQTIWVGMKPEGSGTRVSIAIGPLRQAQSNEPTLVTAQPPDEKTEDAESTPSQVGDDGVQRSVSPREAYHAFVDGLYYVDYATFRREMMELEETVDVAGIPKTVTVPAGLFTFTKLEEIQERFGKHGQVTKHRLPGYSVKDDSGALVPLTGDYYWYGRLGFGVMTTNSGNHVAAVRYVPKSD